MRAIRFCAVLLLACGGALAAHVQFDAQNFVTTALTNRTIRITPRSVPSLSGSGIVARDALSYRTDTNGQVIVSNMVSGTYTVEILGTNAASPSTVFMLTVTNTSDLVNATNWIAVSTSASADFTAYSQSQANGRFILRDGGYGTNTTLSNVVFLGTLVGIDSPTSGISAATATNIARAEAASSSLTTSNTLHAQTTNLAFKPTTLYVSTVGNDTSAVRGREDRPYASVSNALAAVQNGDMVLILPGRYTNNAAGGVYRTDGGHLYKLANRTNVTIEGIGNPVLFSTNIATSELVIDHCNYVTLRGVVIEGRRETNYLDRLKCDTYGHLELIENTNCLVDSVQFLNGSDFGILHPVGGNGNSTAQRGVTIRNCTFRNFGSWIGSAPGCGAQQRHDGAGIAAGAWTIENCYFEDSNAAIEPYPYLASGTRQPMIIRGNRMLNHIAGGIYSVAAHLENGTVIEGNWIKNTAGWNRNGTNYDTATYGIGLGSASDVLVRNNHLDGFSTGIYPFSGCSNWVSIANSFTNCTAEYNLTYHLDTPMLTYAKAGTLQDIYAEDQYGLLWPAGLALRVTEGVGQLAFFRSTNRTGLILGSGTYDTPGVQIVPDDFDGASYQTLSIYDGIGPDWGGALRNLKAKTNFAEAFSLNGDTITAWPVGGSGSGETNVNGEVAVTNATRVGLVYGKSGVTNQLRSLEAGPGILFTNQGTNIVAAVNPSQDALYVGTIVVTNPISSASVTNGTASKLAIWGPDKRATNSQYADTDMALAASTNSFAKVTAATWLTNEANAKQIGSPALSNAVASGIVTNQSSTIGKTNIHSGTGVTNLAFNVAALADSGVMVTIYATNGATLTNWVTEAGDGTRFRRVTLLFLGCSNTPPVLTWPTAIAANAYGVRFWTNDARVLYTSLTNNTATLVEMGWRGTNCHVVNAVTF